MELTLVDIFMLVLVFAVLIGFIIVFNFMFKQKINKKKIELTNQAHCRRARNAHRKRIYMDYFWSNHMRFAWIMLFFVFFIAFGIALESTITTVLSVVLIFITIYFIYFSVQSYKAFPAKAAKQLKDFEAQIEEAVKGEICFDADNIQQFSSKDDAFYTKPELFSFPSAVTKIPFPPYETIAPKQPIIATRKLEFLILSREYFSICKGAATFDLLNPKRAGLPKKCVELPGTAGECREYYYSQIRNVRYDDKDESIHIIYYHEEDEDIVFKCKKAAPNRKPVMKALKGKLRLTERQKLHKIDEHEQYEKILDRRKNDTDSSETTDDEND